ncbi:hypothetical protein AB1N83_011535 [Pleurotus pulmonarius]
MGYRMIQVASVAVRISMIFESGRRDIVVNGRYETSAPSPNRLEMTSRHLYLEEHRRWSNGINRHPNPISDANDTTRRNPTPSHWQTV